MSIVQPCPSSDHSRVIFGDRFTRTCWVIRGKGQVVFKAFSHLTTLETAFPLKMGTWGWSIMGYYISQPSGQMGGWVRFIGNIKQEGDN